MTADLTSENLRAESRAVTKSVGARLRAQRLARQWTVTEAAKASGVRAEYLSAIEKGETENLPSIGYVLGYVRSYARVLGLDERTSVTDYKAELSGRTTKRPRGIPHFVPRRSWRLPKGSIPALGVVAGVVMLGAWYGVELDTRAASLPDAPIALDAKEVEESEATPDTVVTVLANAPSWVSLQDERGQLVVNRVFVTGERWQMTRGASYTLSVRDGAAIELLVGERSLGPIGTQGVPVRDYPLATVQ
jgi:transcriptional regulator with XRE-family HTH domain